MALWHLTAQPSFLVGPVVQGLFVPERQELGPTAKRSVAAPPEGERAALGPKTGNYR